jgi:hypothetical protein
VGLIGFILGLPLAPVRGVVALGRVIQERVEHELRDPSSIRHDLEAAEEAKAAGKITAEDEAEVQQEAMERVTERKLPDAEKG